MVFHNIEGVAVMADIPVVDMGDTLVEAMAGIAMVVMGGIAVVVTMAGIVAITADTPVAGTMAGIVVITAAIAAPITTMIYFGALPDSCLGQLLAPLCISPLSTITVLLSTITVPLFTIVRRGCVVMNDM